MRIKPAGDYTLRALGAETWTKNRHFIHRVFSKAFNGVDHRIMVNKLEKFGLPSNLLNSIKSHLADRTQFVKYGYSELADFGVSSDVPQGTRFLQCTNIDFVVYQ